MSTSGSSRPKIKRDRVKDTSSLPPRPESVASSSKALPSDLDTSLPPKPDAELDAPKEKERKSKRKRNRKSDDQEFAEGVNFAGLDDERKVERKRKRSDQGEEQDAERDAARRERRRNRREQRQEAQKPKQREKESLGTGADFIGFDDSEEEQAEEKPVVAEKKREEREWDRGKPRQRSRDRDDQRRKERAKYEPHGSRYTNHRIPWLNGIELDDCKNVTEVLHREVVAFADYMSPTPAEDEVRGLVVAQIRAAVTAAFPDARVEPFGSYATKLYLPSGDIDLVIISDSMAYSDKVAVLHSLAAALKRARVTDRVSIIAKARVPIVKFVSTHGTFHVDVSINQANGLVGVEIVNGFLLNMRGSLALRALVLITKMFLSQRGMNEVYSGGLGSYAIVCLVVSFLQMHPKIRRAEIDVDASPNLGVLVMEFFELYGCYFNYAEAGISVRDGGTYFSKRQRGWMNDSRGLLLSIEDPADPSNDISSGSFGFSKVKATMAGAYGILTSTAYTKAGIINARRNGEALKLREKYDATDLSILTSIVNVPQDTINHRRVVQEVYDTGKLHQIMGVQPRAEPPVQSTSNGKVKAGPSSSNGKRKHHSEEEEEDHKSDMQFSQTDEEEEGGRYAIGMPPPPKKRRRNEEVVFTTDDEEDEDEGSVDRDYMLSAGIGLEDGETEPDTKPQRPRRHSSKPRSQNAERNREYWSAKGGGGRGGLPSGDGEA